MPERAEDLDVGSPCGARRLDGGRKSPADVAGAEEENPGGPHDHGGKYEPGSDRSAGIRQRTRAETR